MPGRPSGPSTYVRTFASGNEQAHGSAGPRGGRTVRWNRITPTNPAPSTVSISSPAGSRRWSSWGSTGQWRKVSDDHS
jgi:hypothetical protein